MKGKGRPIVGESRGRGVFELDGVVDLGCRFYIIWGLSWEVGKG